MTQIHSPLLPRQFGTYVGICCSMFTPHKSCEVVKCNGTGIDVKEGVRLSRAYFVPPRSQRGGGGGTQLLRGLNALPPSLLVPSGYAAGLPLRLVRSGNRHRII